MCSFFLFALLVYLADDMYSTQTYLTLIFTVTFFLHNLFCLFAVMIHIEQWYNALCYFHCTLAVGD